MTLRPLKGPAQRRRILVYDLEWVPGENTRPGWTPMALRLVGVYDGIRYRSYETIGAFLENELTAKNAGAWIYAHAGGMADIQYVFDYIVGHEGYTIEAAFSGSSAIIVTIGRVGSKLTWTFCDSYWLIRDSLRRIAKWVGLEKGGAAESLDVFYAPLPELRTYNEQDCVILWRAIRIFEQIVLDLGGELQKTIASTALNLFRRRFLGRTIPTSEPLNVLARQSYVASRVEPYAQDCGPANYFDVNSMFPFNMLKTLPGALIGRQKRIPEQGIYLARVRVQVPDCYVPPLPYRAESRRIFFPVGEWEAWITHADLELLYESGGRLLETIEVLTFEPFHDLADYASTLYEGRRVATDDALKIVYKYLLNSLYGKFAESGEKQKVLIRPKSTHCPHTPKHTDDACLTMYAPGIWLLSEQVDVPHAHVPISSVITAESRALLCRYMRRCSEIYYVDTDAFMAPDVFETSDRLGGLKLEKHVLEGEFEGPKLYAFRGYKAGETAEDAKWTVKAKGFRALSIDEYRALSQTRKSDTAEPIKVRRMARIKENLLIGDTSPREHEIIKRLRPIQNKRCRSGGNSRPWNVREIR